MNPVLILLIIIGAIVLWFVLSSLFRSIGGVVNSLADDARYAMYERDENEDNEKESN